VNHYLGDEAAAELVIGKLGLRTFRVSEDGHLVSVVNSGEGDYSDWVGGTCVATCPHQAPRPRPRRGQAHRDPHSIPGDHCTCGVYSMHDPYELECQYPLSRRLLAVVALEGQVIIGDYGSRAEAARVIAVWVRPGELSGRELDGLRLNLPGVRFWSDRVEMTAHHGLNVRSRLMMRPSVPSVRRDGLSGLVEYGASHAVLWWQNLRSSHLWVASTGLRRWLWRTGPALVRGVFAAVALFIRTALLTLAMVVPTVWQRAAGTAKTGGRQPWYVRWIVGDSGPITIPDLSTGSWGLDHLIYGYTRCLVIVGEFLACSLPAVLLVLTVMGAFMEVFNRAAGRRRRSDVYQLLWFALALTRWAAAGAVTLVVAGSDNGFSPYGLTLTWVLIGFLVGVHIAVRSRTYVTAVSPFGFGSSALVMRQRVGDDGSS